MDDLAYQIEQLTKDLPLPCYFALLIPVMILVGIAMWVKRKNKGKENDDG